MRRWRALAVAACALAAGCRPGRQASTREQPGLPKGDAVEFANPAAAAEADLAQRLKRLAVASVFLPAGELSRDGGRWVFRPDPAPPGPIEGLAVVLVVRSGESVSSLLSAPNGAETQGAARALASGLATALREKGPYGKVVAVHLEAPFSAATASRGTELLQAVRKELPRSVFLTIRLATAPATDEERKRIAPLVGAADALEAPVFGTWTRVEAGAADALRRPWWAGYNAASRCVLSSAGGAPRGDVPEMYVDALSGHPRVEFENDLSVVDPDVVAFRLVARGPVRLEGLALEAGDRVACRLPSLPEMLYRLGSATTGKKHLLGRVVVFEGAAEENRLLRVDALEDILLGRSLSPVLEVRVQPAGRSAIAVEATNLSPHSSTASRVANWIEVDLAPAHPADVAVGGFDRYEAYDGEGRAVTPGRATRVRLYETLVAPREVITPARIVVRGALPTPCCRRRTHVLAAAGPEEAADWTEPPAPPTPVPPATKKRK